MLRTVFTAFLFCCFANLGHLQPLTGQWAGEVRQDGKPDSFQYTLELTQQDGSVFGTSSSTSGGVVARFEVGGTFDGKLLILQEVKQLEPENARWCLKHIRLQYAENEGVATLNGNWEAQGCKPGTMRLVSNSTVGSGQSGQTENRDANPEIVVGRYTGHLSQSDRDYGFYFEMEFFEDGTGKSHIVSDGEGGNATHRFKWRWDHYFDTGVWFEETEILEESVPSWRWCMKVGNLQFKEEKNRRFLTGDWKGWIEGTDPKIASNFCAPGKLYVEQPIFAERGTVAGLPKAANSPSPTPAGVTAYEEKTERSVEVGRVLEVRSKTVRIRVWDNGTVDGDVLSLFLNGELIVKNYRVTRQKHETIVTLDKPTNFIILHALNLGSISPNTVAVSVDDGHGEQVIILSSNLDKSGAVMIREFTVK